MLFLKNTYLSEKSNKDCYPQPFYNLCLAIENGLRTS